MTNFFASLDIKARNSPRKLSIKSNTQVETNKKSTNSNHPRAASNQLQNSKQQQANKTIMSHQSGSISSNQRLCASVMLAALALICATQLADAKLLRRSRYYNDGGYMGGASAYNQNYPYGGGAVAAVPTGERAIMTVRGARSPYDGSAPSKITIEDNPYRGAYPRGVYDRLDNGFAGGRGGYLRQDPYDYSNGYGGRGGYGSMFGAPNRIAVTGAFPYGYGSRF